MPRRPETLIRALHDAQELAEWRESLPTGSSLGLVPTMGALHRGHGSLVRRARAECDRVLASVFVNPLQFDEQRDFQGYPRDSERDLALLAQWGADAAYLPTADDMYPEGRPELIQPGPGGELYEGEFRPGHFAGMLTVVHRLFARIRPSRAYFGEKDAQQLFLVREMVAAKGMTLQVVACPTVRDPDGLALSSRNAHLSPEERRRATALHRALRAARAAFHAGERDPRRIESAMRNLLRDAGLRPDYAAVVDEHSFRPAVSMTPSEFVAGSSEAGRTLSVDTGGHGSSGIQPPTAPVWRAVLAVRVGSTRLIDNLSLGGSDKKPDGC